MKETVLQLIKERLEYIEEVEQLQVFWKTNSVSIEKIITHYFSFDNPQHYNQSKAHYDGLVKKVIDSETEQIKEKLARLNVELEDSYYVGKYIELLHKLLFNNQFVHQALALKSLNQYNVDLDIQKLISNEPINIGHPQLLHNFQQSSQSIVQNLETLSQSLASIELFELLKNKGENLVLIGSNGSGKSTFSRQIKKSIAQQSSSFVAVIPAQKTFGVTKNDSIPLKESARMSFVKSHTHDKLFKNTNDMWFANSEFEQMINYLIAEHQEVANTTHQNHHIVGFQKKDSLLEKVIVIWESIITHIKLQYDGQGNIQAIANTGNTYDFMGLSDGEKSIFYCISSVLLVDTDGYIIVDEPENHLHMSIVNKLWDTLEKVRSDCQFVYLTHNPSFAIGRANAKILWVKKYTPPLNWDYEEIPTDDMLPQQLMVELIGSKKKILFCEGERDSYDYKLYSLLFPNYTVIPVGGHQKAIDYCKAFNENTKLSNLSAIAIIDKDFYEADEIEAWKKSDVYALKVMEVENILCDEEILKFVKASVHASDDDYDKAVEQIFVHIDSTKEKQAMEYTRFKIDKVLNSLVGKSNSPIELQEQLNQEITSLDPQSFYNEHLQLLESISEVKNYNKALKHYNNKGIMSFVGDRILKEYKDRVISFIRGDKELQQKILNKYFEDIVDEII